MDDVVFCLCDKVLCRSCCGRRTLSPSRWMQRGVCEGECSMDRQQESERKQNAYMHIPCELRREACSMESMLVAGLDQEAELLG